MKGRTLSEIEHNIRRLRKRTRTRHFLIKLHSMPGLYIENELKLVSNKARFLSSLISGDINGINRKKGELLQEIIDWGFDPIPIEWLAENEDNEESHSEDFTGYDYLTCTPVSCLGEDTLHDLLKRKSELEEIVRSETPLYRGLTCLKISEKEPSVVDVNYEEAQSGSEVWMDVAAKDSNVFQATHRRQHKRTAAQSLEASAMLIDE